ncbi:hypothetical protein LCGC14_1387520 [marine sediment metagenome]|uniref:Uncharacterized protein n=1 Tax=marine sediment metagenome TaxID=412755 RepID=A0A0F9KLQ6_9ZZZZ
MRMKFWYIAVFVECVGVAAVISGITVEFIYEAHVGFTFITSGSLLVAAGGLLYNKFLRIP